MPARISVIIPTFNRPEKLARALNSCAAQTMAPYEVLVVDNGENPETKAVFNAFAAKNALNLHYLQSKKFAQRVALGTGIDRATGDWLTLLDDDDFLVPARIENDIRLIEGLEDGVNLIIQDFVRVDYQNNLIWQHTMAHKKLGIYEALTADEFPPQAAATFRTKSVQAHHCFLTREAWMTDFELFSLVRPHGGLIRSGAIGYIMDDTRTAGRVTGSDYQTYVKAIDQHRELFQTARHRLSDDQASQVDVRLDQQKAFYCAKALGYRAFFGATAQNCRAHFKESIKGCLAPIRGLISKYFSPILPEIRGSKTFSLEKFGGEYPELQKLIEESRL